MRKIFSTAFAALLAAPLAFPQQAFACSCMYYEDDAQRMETYYNNADLVFQGIPMEVEQVDGLRHYNVGVEKVWKGTADAYVDVNTALDSAACGISMELDERMVIFAYVSDNEVHTGLCSGTIAAKDAEDIVSWLNADKQSVSVTTEQEEIDCTPYICESGKEFPACTDEGVAINYLVQPCQFEGGEKQDTNEQPEGFTDVPDTHPYAKAIAFVRNEGIAKGYEDGTYGPNLNINRAEFTKIIIEATYSSETIDECESNELFSDVTQSDWFADYVCMAKAEGVIGGYPDGSFKPGNSINFAEAAKIVVGAFSVPTGEEENIWWKPYVFALARIGGLPQSFTDPNQELTRGDMAEIIYRVMMGIES